MLSHDRVKATKIQLNEVCKKKNQGLKSQRIQGNLFTLMVFPYYLVKQVWERLPTIMK